MKILTDADAILCAANLLDVYQRRLREERQQIAMSGQRAFDGSMRDLAGLIVKLHPELRVNLQSNHVAEGVR